jgi:hypothetical protein
MKDLRDIQEKIDKLDSDKLIQIVKNYQQYGYSEDIRNYALGILEVRGITKLDLTLTGNFENHRFEEANRFFSSFKLDSKIALITYLLLVSSRLLKLHQYISSDFMSLLYILLSLLLLIFFAVCLFKSFMSQSDFYKLTGNDYSDGALIYLLLGLPLYIIMYFVFTNQMSERMKSIT